MVSRGRRGGRDFGRRAYGQHFLVDLKVVDRLLAQLDLQHDDVVVDVGAGRGALTLPLARVGVRVLAIERDRELVRYLQAQIERQRLAGRVQLRRGDLRDTPLPKQPFRVVANPPFAFTMPLLSRLLDAAPVHPTRADLLLQRDVAREFAQAPPATLRAAAWAPWWRFELGAPVSRDAFRPIPAVDAAWLIIRRRDPPVLPWSLSSGFRDVLRPLWQTQTEQDRS